MKRTFNDVLDHLAFNHPLLLLVLGHMALLMIGTVAFGPISLFNAAVLGGLTSSLVTLVFVLHEGRKL